VRFYAIKSSDANLKGKLEGHTWGNIGI